MAVSSSKPAYEVVPLRSDEVRVGVVQSAVKTVNPGNAAEGRRRNVEHLCWLVDNAHGFGKRPGYGKDLVVLHESPIAGWNVLFNREQQLAISIEVPGPETDALARKAREYNCYIAFGSYVKDKDWPEHFINMGILIGPSGDVILKNWKRRNMPGSGFSTAVYDVLDRFLEMYGWDAVFPVARTDIGNICFVPCIFEPEMVRAFAVKGAEIFIRYMTGGLYHRFDVPAACMANKMYGVFINQAVGDIETRFEDSKAGGSAVFDDSGAMVAEASSHHEGMVSATIPMAAFRKRHTIPIIRKALYQKLWEEYECPLPPSTYLKHLPKDKADSIAHYRRIAGQ